jgi:hypothetical protein
MPCEALLQRHQNFLSLTGSRPDVPSFQNDPGLFSGRFEKVSWPGRSYRIVLLSGRQDEWRRNVENQFSEESWSCLVRQFGGEVKVDSYFTDHAASA